MVHQRPHQNQRRGGGVADTVVDPTDALVKRAVAVGSGSPRLDAVLPVLSALSSADFFPVPPDLAASDNGGAQQMHEQWGRGRCSSSSNGRYSCASRCPTQAPGGRAISYSMECRLWGGLFSHGGHVNSMVAMEVWDPD